MVVLTDQIPDHVSVARGRGVTALQCPIKPDQGMLKTTLITAVG